MGDLTLDFPAEGSLFRDTDGHYLGDFRFLPDVHYELSNDLTLTGGAALQIGQENALSDAKVRRLRLQPDPRLLLHFKSGSEDFRLDVPALYLQYNTSPQWQLRLGRYYWDNTMLSRLRDWSYAGFMDGNLANANISVGPIGGELRFYQPPSPSLPVDIKLFASAALGGNEEGLGLIQGLTTFNLFDRYERGNWDSVVGASLGLAYYPRNSLPALLAGIPDNAAGGALSPSIYLQQKFGEDFDIQAGYGRFSPILNPESPALVPLKSRQALNTSADFHQRYWGLHADYGRVWRNDLAGATGTKVEDQLGVSARWMVFGDRNRVLNLTLGGLLAHSDRGFGGGGYAAIEISLLGFTPGKL